MADADHDPLELCTPPAVLESHLRAIRRHGRPVRLLDLVKGLQGESALQGAIAVTFDDGYADVLSTAKPLLERHGIPATVFVATGYLGGEFWWDELSRIQDAEPQADPVLYARLERLPADRRQAEVRRLSASGSGSKCAAEAVRALQVREVAELVTGGLIEVGAHSVTHSRLASLSKADQDKEVADSRRLLERLTGREVHAFAYPHGAYSGETVQAVREAGYRCACASVPDVCRVGTDLFAVPRLWPGSRDADGFSRWLRWWLGE